jgi:hypothetical protein
VEIEPVGFWPTAIPPTDVMRRVGMPAGIAACGAASTVPRIVSTNPENVAAFPSNLTMPFPT